MKIQMPFLGFALSFVVVSSLHAELKLPAIISDHMVLQQKQENPLWGWDTPGTKVAITFADQKKSAVTDKDGKWTVTLDPVPANAEPQTIKFSGTTEKVVQDVLVGEVWMCSGQSNMGFQLVQEWNGDLEAAASKFPNLRLIKVPNVGSQEPQMNFKGEWKPSSKESASGFSAIGFLYGRYLHQILGVPVGLIDNAWGGSAAEAWVRRSSLESDARFKSLIDRNVEIEKKKQSPEVTQEYEKLLAEYEVATKAAETAGKPAPRKPQSPEAWLNGNSRPGNLFNGLLVSTLGYGIKGVIWYQGESNASAAYEYAELFPFMIEQWRKEWKQGDFPFYWVQLADFMAEKPEPTESTWAELRESQTKTMKLPNTGQAVIIDIGEGKDIHPKNKADVATRLVRWPLVKDYGMTLPFRSPEFESLKIEGGKALVTINCFGSSLRPFDLAEVRGFAVCGEDKVWHWATGKLIGKNQVELTCEEVANPIAVRYAWADNPVCNLFSDDGLPVTPFRSDEFEMITKPKAQPPTPVK